MITPINSRYLASYVLTTDGTLSALENDSSVYPLNPTT